MTPEPYYHDEQITLYHGHALDVARQLPTSSVHCITTSPPYYLLRDYGVDGQYGLEATPAAYVENLRALFAELKRILTPDGTLWLNLGDSYASDSGNGRGAGSALAGRKHDRSGAPQSTTHQRKPGVTLSRKNLLGIPWRVAFALQDDGWILRRDIIWHKPNGLPSSATDRPASSHEYVFLFSKSSRYWFDLDAISVPVTTRRATALNWARDTKEGPVPGQPRQHRPDRTPYAPGMNAQNIKAATGRRHDLAPDHPGKRNPGDVWSITTKPFPAAHFAVMAPELAQRCVMAGCRPGGTVLDPCSGVGTTGQAAQRTGRRYIGIDLNAEYLDLSLKTRLRDATLDFGDAAAATPDTTGGPKPSTKDTPTLYDTAHNPSQLGEAS
ncbi:DNA-methyltransferase [Mycolicibacterium wolinskyi]|uniref:DNA-methyltransferase n=1 Tax=Mycolicibacterium wolinskyi TaxID=59750 RepID=UPI0009FEAB44|nr:site-specific DNA-methyltransferase [Mycolicibacterium wolinskyi]